jgi:hypothetical protein
MDLGGAPPRVDPNRRLKVPSEAIVRARRPRQENDRELSPQALAAIAEAARRSREARVGPEPRTMRPAEPRATRPPESPRSRPVEESVAGTPDLPTGPQGAMARTQTREAPAVPVNPSGPPTQQGRATEGVPVSQTDPVVAAGTFLPPSGGTRSIGTEGSDEPVDPAEASPVLEARRPVRGRRGRAPGAGERRLRWAIGLTAVLLVVVVAAMVGTRSGAGGQASGRTTSTSAGPGAPPTRPSTPPTKPGTVSAGGSSGAGTTSSTSTPTSTPPAEPGGSPVLSTVEPSTGYAGESVAVTGSNFLSSSGQITADVDGQVAPVTCPDQQTCTVVIPADPGATASVPVTITTDSGTSNALIFTYGEADGTGSGGNQGPHPRHATRSSRPVRRRHQPPGR